MKALLLRAGWLVPTLLAAFGGAACAEIIDRIAVSVANQVVTEDQINEEIRVTAFLNREKTTLSAKDKREAAERLIEQTLIRREIEFSRYSLPGLSEADQSVKSIESQYGGQADFQKALADYGITEKDLQRHLWWQLAVVGFVDYRFRPAVRVPEADVKAYYDQQAVRWREQGVQPVPTFDDSRDKIDQMLTEQRISQALDRWLGDTRTQVEIRYRPGAFQ